MAELEHLRAKARIRGLRAEVTTNHDGTYFGWVICGQKDEARSNYKFVYRNEEEALLAALDDNAANKFIGAITLP